MRVYKGEKLIKVVCNNCGKNITVKNSTIKEANFDNFIVHSRLTNC